MAWARVDDGWWCHHKVMDLSLASRGLWVSALSWSCAHRREIVPERFVLMVGASKAEANELACAGLWVECPDGWRIHDWAHYQDKSLSEKRADAGRKGGQKSRPPEANEKQTALLPQANGEAGALPVPTRPVPALPVPEETTTAPSDQDIRAAAVAVGRAIADRAIGLDPSKLGAYATATTQRILQGPDPTDRDRINDELRSGRTGPEIADGWHRLDLGADRPAQPSGPRLDDWTGAGDQAPAVDRALSLDRARALRDVIRPSEAS